MCAAGPHTLTMAPLAGHYHPLMVQSAPMADQTDDSQQEYIPAEVYNRELDAMQDSLPAGGVSREMNRRSVTRNILSTFELIGGVPRFADWASENPTEFYRMYARQAPKDDGNDGSESTKIVHVIPRGKLDQ